MLVKTCYKPELIKTFAFFRVTFHLWVLFCYWWTKYATGLFSREFSWLWFYYFLSTSDCIVLDIWVIRALSLLHCTKLAKILNSKMFASLLLHMCFVLLTALCLFY